jgi:hypothetical protein
MHGIDSVVLHYRGAGGQLAAEVFFFNSAGLVTRACANYEISYFPRINPQTSEIGRVHSDTAQ